MDEHAEYLERYMNEAHYPGAVALPVLSFDHYLPATDRRADHAGLGWVTAANAVSLTSEAMRIGVVNARGIGEALVGSALLLFGGLLAAAIIRAGRTGPPQGYATFAATVTWALAAIIVAQYEGSHLTTGAAAVAALPVLLFVFREPRGGRARPGTRGTARSRAI